MPQVSIIITTHARPHMLPRAIESARRAGSDVEIIVVDDASTDETAEVCRNFPDIHYVRAERNQRVAGARNLGVLASKGDYLTFLDDDDARLPDSLNVQVEALLSAPAAGFVYGQVLVSDQQGMTDGSFYPENCPEGELFWPLLERNFIPCCSAVFRKSCLYSVGLLDESIPGIDDWDLWIRLAEVYKVVAVEKPVAVWRRPTRDSGQGSSATVDLISLGARQFSRRWLALPRAQSSTSDARRRAWRGFSENVAEHLAWEAASACAAGNLRQAVKSSLAALRLHPSAVLGIARRWARPSTVRAFLDGAHKNADLEEVKMRFKQMRLSRDK